MDKDFKEYKPSCDFFLKGTIPVSGIVVIVALWVSRSNSISWPIIFLIIALIVFDLILWIFFSKRVWFEHNNIYIKSMFQLKVINTENILSICEVKIPLHSVYNHKTIEYRDPKTRKVRIFDYFTKDTHEIQLKINQLKINQVQRTTTSKATNKT
jgi:hypothetical protein